MRLTALSLGPLAALLLPKCPMCLVAWAGLGAWALPWARGFWPAALAFYLALLTTSFVRTRQIQRSPHEKRCH